MQSDIIFLPLQEFSDEDEQQLVECLWALKLCDDCVNSRKCQSLQCLTAMSRRLARFMVYYQQITAFYEPDVKTDTRPILCSHKDLYTIIKALKKRTEVPRERLLFDVFEHSGNPDQYSDSDRQQVLNLATRIITMVDCNKKFPTSGDVEHGSGSIRWPKDLTFKQFMSKSFPQSDHPIINGEASSSQADILAVLKATKLQKHAGLKFRPTDDLRDHLRFDRTTGFVDIFHHTAFLKEHLRLRGEVSEKIHESVSEAWEGGLIPRQLGLEVIDSIQKLLFPLTDHKCRKMLESLVARSHFDPDCLRFESANIRTPDEQNIGYLYFGSRLADLYEEVQNPKPRGILEEWLERKSGARYVMLATLIGVAIAILLGILTLIVSIYQAYIAYQAWQHPVSGSA